MPIQMEGKKVKKTPPLQRNSKPPTIDLSVTRDKVLDDPFPLVFEKSVGFFWRVVGVMWRVMWRVMGAMWYIVSVSNFLVYEIISTVNLLMILIYCGKSMYIVVQ